jgi:hypothetical protein
MRTAFATIAGLLLFASLADAGRVPGPGHDEAVVAAKATYRYTETFRAGEVAAIALAGDGVTDLDLYVFDENGNLIEKDDDSTDRCFVSWTPKWTGPFVIKVVNRGYLANRFVIRTN